jgi:hypothetical protein
LQLFLKSISPKSQYLIPTNSEEKMLTSVEGVYRNGRIELEESPSGVPEGTWVIVTFVRADNIDLKSQGIDGDSAASLRASLVTFSEDWESPEMSIYDNYDAAKVNS